MNVWGHALVCNEEKYLWFSVTSIIDYVDKLLLWDTGSTDKTCTIIDDLERKYKNKIITKQVGKVDINDFTKVRQQMLNQTKGDWFIILDGDEVWWRDSIFEIREILEAQDKSLETIVSRYYNLVGDVFHYQSENIGKYKIDNRVGNLTIRAMNTSIPGLNFSKPHGQQGIFDDKAVLVQERNKEKRLFINNPAYLHFTHLIRSSNIVADKEVIKRNIKYKYELGEKFPSDFYYPEVFFKPYPSYISCPWKKRSTGYEFIAFIQTPIKLLKRKLLKSKSGY